MAITNWYTYNHNDNRILTNTYTCYKRGGKLKLRFNCDEDWTIQHSDWIELSSDSGTSSTELLTVTATIALTTTNRLGEIKLVSGEDVRSFIIYQFSYDNINTSSFKLFAVNAPYWNGWPDGKSSSRQVQLTCDGYCNIVKWQITEEVTARTLTGNPDTGLCTFSSSIFEQEATKGTTFIANVKINTDQYTGSDWEFTFSVPVFKECWINTNSDETVDETFDSSDWGLVLGNPYIDPNGNLTVKTALCALWSVLSNRFKNPNISSLRLSNIHSGSLVLDDINYDIGTPEQLLNIKLPENIKGNRYWSCDLSLNASFQVVTGGLTHHISRTKSNVSLGRQLAFSASDPERPGYSPTFNIEVPVSGGTFTLGTFSDLVIDSYPEWITVSNDETFSIDVTQNINTNARTGNIVYTAGGITYTVVINQSPLVAGWRVETPQYYPSASGGEILLIIDYNLRPNDIITDYNSFEGVTWTGWTIGDTSAYGTITFDPAGGSVLRDIRFRPTLNYNNVSYPLDEPALIQNGTDYQITPETSPVLTPEGGNVIYKVTSNYPLYYNRVYYKDRSDITPNLYVNSETELEIVCTIPSSGEDVIYEPILSAQYDYGLNEIKLPTITQKGWYIELNYPETVTSVQGTFEIQVSSNDDWTVSNLNNLTVDKTSGSGSGVIKASYDEWFTYSSDRILSAKISSGSGTHIVIVTQTNTIPWIVLNTSTKTLPYTGDTITSNNFSSNTNCNLVNLSTSVGTITPTIHTGEWGETTSIDFVLDVPVTNAARTITITGTSETSDGSPIVTTYDINQEAPYSFDIDVSTLRNIKQDGGVYSMEYTTSAPSVELTLTSVPDFITDFTYTQPVDGVGTFSLNYESNFLNNSRYSHPYIEAVYDGISIGKIRINDYQLGTSFLLPDDSKTISHREQVFRTSVNTTLDVKQSNIYVYPVIDGLTLNSYTPATSTSAGTLYINVPLNTGGDRTFRLKVGVRNDEGVEFITEEGTTITQLEVPPLVDIEVNVNAAYHKESVNVESTDEWLVESKTQWISPTSEPITESSYVTFLISANLTGQTRVGYVYAYGKLQTYRIKVVQSPMNHTFDPDGDAIPICETITYEADADKVEYHIIVDGETVYSGYAYRYPDEEGNLKIEVNDIFSDYLKNHISFTEGLREMDGFLKEFTIRTNYGTQEVLVYNGWEKPKWPMLNDPISNDIDPRQYLFINYIDGYDDLRLFKNGEEIGGLGKICGGVYVVPRVDAVCGEEVWYDIRQVGEDVVAAQNYVYKGTNKNYALYYVNAYGGWDSLAIRGNVTQTDNMQSQTYKNKTNGKVKYLNTITPTWQLYTDDMNDGSKMHHLLESTEVYLHNLETDEIVPVIITDSNCVYKTYANQGNTRFHYIINVEASNYKIRK